MLNGNEQGAWREVITINTLTGFLKQNQDGLAAARRELVDVQTELGKPGLPAMQRRRLELRRVELSDGIARLTNNVAVLSAATTTPARSVSAVRVGRERATLTR
jgi:hypothetical protein